MGVVTYFREVLFYDITIIPRSRFLGDNGKQSILPNGKTIKRCIIHKSPYWKGVQILREIVTKAYGASVKYVNDYISLHIYSLIQNKVVYSRPIF
jgi:hypothetical protein